VDFLRFSVRFTRIQYRCDSHLYSSWYSGLKEKQQVVIVHSPQHQGRSILFLHFQMPGFNPPPGTWETLEITDGFLVRLDLLSQCMLQSRSLVDRIFRQL